jgi:hypothetical protein
MELVTGRLSSEEYEAEVAAVAQLLVAAGVDVVLVAFGGGCDFSQVDPLEPVPVAPALLAGFVDEQEERGTYRMGRSDLFLKADDGRVSFLLCEEGDIHCYTTDRSMFEDVRERWAAAYPSAYEQNNESRSRRNLRGGPSQPFGVSTGEAEPAAVPPS